MPWTSQQLMHDTLTSARSHTLTYSQHGKTALHYCCSAGEGLIAKLLLLYGAKLTIRDAAGRTAIDTASDHGESALVVELISHLNAASAFCQPSPPVLDSATETTIVIDLEGTAGATDSQPTARRVQISRADSGTKSQRSTIPNAAQRSASVEDDDAAAAPAGERSSWTTVSLCTEDSKFCIRNLEPATGHVIRVAVLRDFGWGPWSPQSAVFQTLSPSAAPSKSSSNSSARGHWFQYVKEYARTVEILTEHRQRPREPLPSPTTASACGHNSPADPHLMTSANAKVTRSSKSSPASSPARSGEECCEMEGGTGSGERRPAISTSAAPAAPRPASSERSDGDAVPDVMFWGSKATKPPSTHRSRTDSTTAAVVTADGSQSPLSSPEQESALPHRVTRPSPPGQDNDTHSFAGVTEQPLPPAKPPRRLPRIRSLARNGTGEDAPASLKPGGDHARVVQPLTPVSMRLHDPHGSNSDKDKISPSTRGAPQDASLRQPSSVEYSTSSAGGSPGAAAADHATTTTSRSAAGAPPRLHTDSEASGGNISINSASAGKGPRVVAGPATTAVPKDSTADAATILLDTRLMRLRLTEMKRELDKLQGKPEALAGLSNDQLRGLEDQLWSTLTAVRQLLKQ